MAGFSLSSGEWEVDSWPLVVRNGQYFSLNLFPTLTPTLNLFRTLPLTLNLTPTLPLTPDLPFFTPHSALPTFHSPMPACTVVTIWAKTKFPTNATHFPLPTIHLPLPTALEKPSILNFSAIFCCYPSLTHFLCFYLALSLCLVSLSSSIQAVEHILLSLFRCLFAASSAGCSQKLTPSHPQQFLP